LWIQVFQNLNGTRTKLDVFKSTRRAYKANKRQFLIFRSNFHFQFRGLEDAF